MIDLRAGEGVYFDGVDDYAELDNVELGGPMTISLWVKWEAITDAGHLFDFGNGDTNNNIKIKNDQTTNTLQAAGRLRIVRDVAGFLGHAHRSLAETAKRGVAAASSFGKVGSYAESKVEVAKVSQGDAKAEGTSKAIATSMMKK